MEHKNAAYWIKHLNLQAHPEGGFYKEVFRSDMQVTRLSSSEKKRALTSIYYLLEEADFSGFHRITSDELWYFHKGAPLLIHAIDPTGNYTTFELSDTASGSLSVAIKAGLWFASEIPSKTGFALVSCAVAPGFEFSGFEMAKKQELATLYPHLSLMIDRLCR
ncbi:cupin domain-containing protein [Mucilaginibacter sp.]|uniref:cupin domain-containing protein n=1 Tax=Mucilaginibacter sp. TaxID=1882438 RepID=UPI002843EA9D|nr:cupin domain-containing protein [Mucilaginibacter sp.]MDR3695997.1 cupin domain-containing protein [Mucilaginibacter sp.]